LYKRDADTQPSTTKEKKKMSKLANILKSANITRDQIVEAVESKAQKIAKREGVSLPTAISLAWEKHPEAALAYDRCAKSEPRKPERPAFRCTPAEARLDDLARKIMKRQPGLGYIAACAKALTPELYDSYQRELAGGVLYDVPTPSEYLNARPGSKRFSDGGDEGADDLDGDDDGGECPSCGEDVDDGDCYCAACGSPLEKDDPGTQSVGTKRKRKTTHA
jgi:hypothetical protein